MRLYTVYYILVNCSTCFGWYLHPSSGAHITVITASGTGQLFLLPAAIVGGVGTVFQLPPETCRAFYKNIINCIYSRLVGQLLTWIDDSLA